MTWLILAAGSADASTPEHRAAAAVAATLGLPLQRIRILAERPLEFAFVDGDYKIYTVRDLGSGKTRDVALDQRTGERIDPDALKARERQLAASEGAKLAPDLRDLLLRHPELEAIEVRAKFAAHGHEQLEAELARLGIEAEPSSGEGGPVLETRLSAPQIASLAKFGLVRSIQLLTEPVILDR